jgi:hypothetical protein
VLPLYLVGSLINYERLLTVEDFVSLNDALGNAPFNSAYELFDNVDDRVNYINGLIASVNSDVILNKLVTIRQKDKPIDVLFHVLVC